MAFGVQTLAYLPAGSRMGESSGTADYSLDGLIQELDAEDLK